MLEYGKIDISEGNDINETNLSKECDICHYWYFEDIALNMNHIFLMVVIILWKKVGVLIMLLLFMLKEIHTEFIFMLYE